MRVDIHKKVYTRYTKPQKASDLKQPTLVVMLRNNYLFTCLLLALKL